MNQAAKFVQLVNNFMAKTYTLVRMTVKIVCNRRGMDWRHIEKLGKRLYKAAHQNSITRDVSVACGDDVTHYTEPNGRMVENFKHTENPPVGWR